MYEENFCLRRIRELMEQNNDNFYSLGRKSGIAFSTLSSMFEKNTEPRVQTIEKICAACKITVAQFFERTSRDLTEEQGELLDTFNSLTPENKEHLFSYLNYLANNNKN